MTAAVESSDGDAGGGRPGGGARPRPLAPAWTALLAAYAVLAIGTCLAAAILWGPWLDEFYSLYATDPGLPFPDAWTAWATDNHPFYFSLLTRQLRDLLPLSLIGLRLANLVPLLAVIGVAGLCWRRDREGRLLVALSLVLLLSSDALFVRFADFRSYFTLLAASYANALATAWLFRAPAMRRFAIGLWLASAAVVANSHYLGTLFAALQAAVLAVILGIQGRRRLALGLAAATGLLTLPSVGFALYQSRHILSKTGGHFWVQSTTGDALAMIGDALAEQTGFNLVAWATCLAAAAWALGRERGGGLRALGPALRCGSVLPGLLAVLGAGLAFAAVLLLVNLHTPIFVPRYLVPLNGPLCVGLALVASRPGPAPLRIAVPLLVLINAALAVALLRTADLRLPPQRWNATASYVARQVQACPTTRVFAIDSMHSGAPRFSRVWITGYRYLARRHGFDVTPLPTSGSVASNPAGPCPELFWLEHLLGVPPDASGVAWMRRAGIDFISDPRRTGTFWGESGGVIVVSPAG